MTSVPDFLKRVPLFHKLTSEGREHLSRSLKSQFLKKGEVLFHKDSRGKSLYIIKQGKIKITLLSNLGDEVVLAILAEGDFFGEMALLDGMPRSADAIAVEPTEVMLLDHVDFISFLVNNQQAVQAVLQSLTSRLRRADDLLEDTCLLSIQARFAKKLVDLAVTYGHSEGDMVTIDLPLTQKDLASMVGATRESINKELRVLREKELVSVHGNKICIHNLERLKQRAH